MAAPRYVELLRVSSRGQADKDTPEDQRRAFDRMRRDRGGTLVETLDYGAKGLSGAKGLADRPDLQRLAELSRAKAYDEIRVRHVDRLTRHPDPRERFAIFGMAQDAGAVIVDASGHVIDPRSELGEFDYYIRTWMAQKDRAQIAEKTMEAKRRLATSGRLATGRPPWGRAFDKRAGVWSTTPAAKDYRRLFELAIEGLTLWQIAARLETEGISSERGRPWTAGMIHNLIRAPHAVGRGRSLGVEIAVPPIVDEWTQRRAMAALKAKDNAGGAHVRYEALLRKILVCGVCGSSCRTNRNTGPNAPPYYHCSARDPNCYRVHPIADVDAAVKQRLREWLQRPGPLAIGAEGAPEGGDPANDAQEAAKALRRLDREEERIARLMRRGVLSEKVATSQLEEIATLRADATREAENAKARVEAAERRAEMAASLAVRVDELRRGLGRATFAEWRELVEIIFPRALGYSVVIWPDGKVRLRGAVTVGASGDEQLRRARGDASSRSRNEWSIPVLLEARTR